MELAGREHTEEPAEKQAKHTRQGREVLSVDLHHGRDRTCEASLQGHAAKLESVSPLRSKSRRLRARDNSRTSSLMYGLLPPVLGLTLRGYCKSILFRLSSRRTTSIRSTAPL